jgi:hypothetical protein
MTRTWNDLEGISLAGRYWLKQCLSTDADGAWFLARCGDGEAAVRLLPAGPDAAEQLDLWRTAAAFDHPNIVRLLDAGQAGLEGLDVLYAVCEYPDDFLLSALAERPLSTAEAAGVLDACSNALAFLHERGLTHGAVAAEHIMAVGDRIKLPADTIRRDGSPADDLWALGATVTEVLTRERPAPGAAIPWLPEPFGTVVRHTMTNDPAERWTAAEVQAHLHPPVAAAAPEPQPAIAPPPALVAVMPESSLRKWLPLAGLVAAAGLGALLLPHSKPPLAKPVQTAPAPPTPHVEAPAPAQNAAVRQADAIWRVVAFEYSRRAAAEHKARSLNQKRPALHAEVFAPRGNRAPYLVALGGFMTRSEAERLKKQARAAGMPRDTFVRNYTQ